MVVQLELPWQEKNWIECSSLDSCATDSDIIYPAVFLFLLITTRSIVLYCSMPSLQLNLPIFILYSRIYPWGRVIYNIKNTRKFPSCSGKVIKFYLPYPPLPIVKTQIILYKKNKYVFYKYIQPDFPLITKF